MGLDMYLSHEVHISNYNFDPAGQKVAKAVMKALKLTKQERFADGSLEVSLPIGYWRKANAIHAWFVEHVQNGEDNCQTSSVDLAQLQDLKELCKKVLLVPATAAEFLPAQEGFFFGSTAYDEGYLQDLRDTMAIIDAAVELNEECPGTLYYRASW